MAPFTSLDAGIFEQLGVDASTAYWNAGTCWTDPTVCTYPSSLAGDAHQTWSLEGRKERIHQKICVGAQNCPQPVSHTVDDPAVLRREQAAQVFGSVALTAARDESQRS
ncbi:hypothetical protein PR202_gb09626 [Eleusine coracana subsp. coracana]|uniref:Uncharacterized protein n=1 Tax=Eleusine coracana subsp. coracana TaxID=191504 RepID=A0AAV5EFF0_ELECO|nr:hypothetical protein PR202_gb09626 [Eleusine coracana subsp. coracana]